MNITRAAAIGAVIALSLPTAPAMAQKVRMAARPAPAVAKPLAMDVAGVRLAMPLAAAKAVLAGTYADSDIIAITIPR